MNAADPLYGHVELPSWLTPVLQSPELQRLREVRLINTSSPSCAALSDVRRYSHIIGVLRLATRLTSRSDLNLSLQQAQCFVVSSAMHDVGTPAFGHLFEYLLSALSGWSHEEFLSSVIRGTYRPEKRYHQIYYGNALRLHHALHDLRLDPDQIMTMVLGRGPFGTLLAGSIDLDNLDNVFRMALMLGLAPEARWPLLFVDQVAVLEGELILPPALEAVLAEWARLRREVYEFLAFDVTTLGTQAMLTDALTIALRRGLLGQEHWYFTDEQMLAYLFSHHLTRELIRRFSVGDVYSWLGTFVYNVGRGATDLRHPDVRDRLAARIGDVLGVPCSPYVFYDNGSFAKEISFRTPGGERKVVGMKSRSTIVAVFSKRRGISRRNVPETIVDGLGDFGLGAGNLMRTFVPETHALAGQTKISFGT